MKKHLSLLLVLAMLFVALTGCASPATTTPATTTPATTESAATTPATTESAETKPTEAAPVKASELYAGKTCYYIVNSEKTDVQIILNHYLEELVKAAGGEIIVQNPDGDSSVQAQLIEDCLIHDPDIIFLKPLDSAAVAPAVKKANQAGVPVVTLDMSMSPDADCVIAADCHTDQYSTADLALEFIVNKANETGIDQKVVEIYGDMATQLVHERGPLSFDINVEKYDNVELVAATESKWDAATAYTATMDMFTAHPDATAIFSHSDCMASGIIQALEDLGKLYPNDDPRHIWFCSIDGEAIGCQYIKEGYLDQISNNDPLGACMLAFLCGIDIINGYDVPEKLLPASYPITIDNVDEAWSAKDIKDIANWGWYDVSDVYQLQTPYVEG